MRQLRLKMLLSTTVFNLKSRDVMYTMAFTPSMRTNSWRRSIHNVHSLCRPYGAKPTSRVFCGPSLQQRQIVAENWHHISNVDKVDSDHDLIFLEQGKHKWLGGVVDHDGDGSIYGVPSNAHYILRIRPPCKVQRTSSLLPHSASVRDGTIGKNDLLGAQSPQQQVQMQDRQSCYISNNGTVVDKIRLPRSAQQRRYKWLRGIIANRDLYGIPSWCTHGVLKVSLDDVNGADTDSPARDSSDSTSASRPTSQLICGENKGSSNDMYNEQGEGTKVQILHMPRQYNNDVKCNRIGCNISRWMWHGAALSKSQRAIYCIPANAQRILRIDIATDAITEIGPSFTGPSKWYGGICGGEKHHPCIYGIPYCERGVLKINPATDCVDILDDYGVGHYNWHGGVLSDINDAIYAFPAHSKYVLKIDTSGKTCGVEQLSLLTIRHCGPNNDSFVSKYKYLGGAIGADGCIYVLPSDATVVLKINPRTDECITFGNLAKKKNKWQGGVLGGDGVLYGIPSNAENVLCINTNPPDWRQGHCNDVHAERHNMAEEGGDESWRLSFIGDLPDVKDKWQGAFLGHDGVIYCIPENADSILQVHPGRSPRVEFLEDQKKVIC